MTNNDTATAVLRARRANLIEVCAKEAGYEFLKSLRLPVYSVSTVAFPLMFYVLFGLVMGRQMIGKVSSAVYFIPSYGTFAVMGASLFGTAASLATERRMGWLEVKQATPMPLAAYFTAKVGMSLSFAAIDVLLLLLVGVAFGGVHLVAATAAKLVLTLVAGAIPFCVLGLAIGYFAEPSSAPAVINLLYLPLSFFSGLWIPIMFLPHFMQRVAPFLPPYHLLRLAGNLVGAGTGESASGHWLPLAGFTMISLGIAWMGHRRDQRMNG
jgi:ABC-2 type transport system permease protein